MENAIKTKIKEAIAIKVHNRKKDPNINSYGAGFDDGYIEGIKDLALEIMPELNGAEL